MSAHAQAQQLLARWARLFVCSSNIPMNIQLSCTVMMQTEWVNRVAKHSLASSGREWGRGMGGYQEWHCENPSGENIEVMLILSRNCQELYGKTLWFWRFLERTNIIFVYLFSSHHCCLEQWWETGMVDRGSLVLEHAWPPQRAPKMSATSGGIALALNWLRLPLVILFCAYLLQEHPCICHFCIVS